MTNGGWSTNSENLTEESSIFYVNLDKNGMLSSIAQVTSMIGKTMNAPLYHACINTSGSDYLNIKSITIKVEYNSEEVIDRMYLFDSRCFDFTPSYKNEMNIFASYKYDGANSDLNIDRYPNHISNPINVSVDIRKNSFAIFPFLIILIIGYYSLLLLAHAVIKLNKNP